MKREIVHLGKHYFPDFGGIETATQNLAEAGVQLGHRVTCVTAGSGACLGRKYELNGVEIQRSFTLGKLLSTPIAFGMLKPRRLGDSLVHVHLPNPLAELSALLFYRGRTLLPFFHALPFRGKGLGRIWYSLVTRRLLRRSRRILISSPHLLEVFPALAEFSDRVITVPFVSRVASAAEVKEWWDQRDGTTVLALGRLVPYKGFVELLDAWVDVVRDNPALKLMIVGEGPLFGELKNRLRRLGIETSVTLIPGCTDEEKERLFRRASLFVLPSVNEAETFGIAAMEGMAHGLPLVTTNVPTGLKALARGGRCGALAAAGNVTELARALRVLMGKPKSDLAQIGERNRRFVAENFSPESLALGYANLIDELNQS